MSAPLVAVTGPARTGAGFGFCTLGLWAAGARVRRLRPPYSPRQLEGLSGLVVGGGAHIDPARYSQAPEIDYVYDVHRDEFEWNVLDAALPRRLPVLGICRGAQLINVFRGGTLFQNLVADIPGLELRRSVLARKHVTVVPRTLLARVMRTERVRVNSLHAQGIRCLGAGLRVSARDQHGLVQAIESQPERAQPPLLGVQWHPEFLLTQQPHRMLFDWLVRAASAPPAAHG